MHHGKRVVRIRPPRFHDPFLDGTILPASDARVLVWDPPPDVDLAPVAGSAAVVSGWKPHVDRLSARGVPVTPDLPEAADVAVLFLPRNRVQAMGRIAAALTLLPAGGWLLVDGAKTDGVEPVLKVLDKAIPATGRVSRDHGKAAWLRRPDAVPDVVAKWAAEAEARVGADGLLSAPGMFAHGAIDAGTQALIEALPGGLTGQVADLGAGWGVLARAVLAAHPGITRLDAVEADHASAEAARRNIEDARAHVHWADATRWGGGPCDAVVMNPPFHASRKGDPGIGTAFIAAAARCLAPKGVLYMVANRHLPYEAALDAQFRDRVEIGGNPRYKVYRASRPTGRR